MSDKENSVGTMLAVFAVGALAGAAVALLLAPASGAETRRKLAEKARQGRDRADELAREARDLFQRQRENIASAVDRGREAFEQARKETL
jgi:gas vesicle protein